MLTDHWGGSGEAGQSTGLAQEPWRGLGPALFAEGGTKVASPGASGLDLITLVSWIVCGLDLVTLVSWSVWGGSGLALPILVSWRIWAGLANPPGLGKVWSGLGSPRVMESV